MKRLLCCCVFLLLLGGPVQAHPVIFEGGVATSAVLRPSMSVIHTNYTLQRHFALGATYLRLQLDDRLLDAGLGQVNVLLARWNEKGSQANIYLSAGGGYGHQSQTISPGGTPVGLVATQADFETTRFYTAVNARFLYIEERFPWMVQLRVGVAPYEAKYKELQAWLVVQGTIAPAMEHSWSVTPMLRFFYRQVLWELGASTRGAPWIQIMAHF